MEPRAVGVCSNPVRHAPGYAYVDLHHKIPKGGTWGGPDTPDNKIPVCPNCHHAIHWLIDQAIQRDGVPYARHLSKFVNELAQYAWDHRPEHPTPTLHVHW